MPLRLTPPTNSFSTAVEYLQRALELRQTTCRHLSSKADGPDAGSRRTETEGKKKMRRGMEDREIVGESMLALGACFTQLGTIHLSHRSNLL